MELVEHIYYAFISKWGMKRNRASAASDKIFEKIIGRC